MVYPNPVSDILHIISETEYSARLFDLNGRLVHSGTNDQIINMTRMGKGVYLLELTAGGKTTRLKIVRE